MKKVLMVVALVGMFAGPAFAGIAPVNPTVLDSSYVQEVNMNSKVNPVAPRGTLLGYLQNDPNNAYDHMLGQFGLDGPASYLPGASPYMAPGAFILNDVTLAPNYTAISGAQLLWYNTPGATAANQPVTIAFFSNPGGNWTSVGATIAAFAYPTVGVGFFIGGFGFPQIVVPGDFWMAVAFGGGGGAATQMFGGPGGQMHGDAPTSTGGVAQNARFRGSAQTFGQFAFVPGSPASPIASGHMNFTLQGKPEPATIGLLAIGGLLALRRRKA
jgi:hypothetical protein